VPLSTSKDQRNLLNMSQLASGRGKPQIRSFRTPLALLFVFLVSIIAQRQSPTSKTTQLLLSLTPQHSFGLLSDSATWFQVGSFADPVPSKLSQTPHLSSALSKFTRGHGFASTETYATLNGCIAQHAQFFESTTASAECKHGSCQNHVHAAAQLVL